MKKKTLDLSKKLIFSKDTIAALNEAAQQQLAGGITGSRLCEPETVQISSCIATSPRPGGLCCQIW
jgi:hypothetical protein